MFWLIAAFLLVCYVLEERARLWKESQLDAEMRRIRDDIAARERDRTH